VSSNDLDDLHQEVWVRVYRGLGARPFTGHFRGWLFQIARNIVIDHGRRPVRGLPLPGDDEFHHDGPTPPEVLTRRELFEQLERCLGRLQRNEAAVVRARTAGHGYEDVCSTLGIDRNAAYKLYSQATARLAECMKRTGP
jgi:RNA polymerase sigma factor (sigma-70 family)